MTKDEFFDKAVRGLNTFSLFVGDRTWKVWFWLSLSLFIQTFVSNPVGTIMCALYMIAMSFLIGRYYESDDE